MRIIEIEGSHGSFRCDELGNILRDGSFVGCACDDCNGEGYTDYARMNVTEWDVWHERTWGQTSDLADVTELGAWLKGGEYLEPSDIFRALQEERAREAKRAK